MKPNFASGSLILKIVNVQLLQGHFLWKKIAMETA